jgi:hypothetical protein
MWRAILVFVLAVSICFQGFALAGPVAARDLGGDSAHAVLHAEGVPHHHQHDGSIHKDQSKKSKQHVQDDHCAAVAFIPSSAPITPEAQPARDISHAQPHGHDSAFLEGLKRPPRTTA